VTVKLFDYVGLIKQFLNKEISVYEFEKTYLAKFKAEKTPMSDDTFLLLDWLFAEIDAFTDDPTAFLEDQHDYIDENQLRQSAEKTLRELEK
jgi:predicted NACHT family NTPase